MRSPAPRVIALLGLRGSGKTTVGRRLARRLRLRFVELDKQIEARAGMPLGEVFSLHGEEFYRRLERDTLTDLLASRQSMVLAVGRRTGHRARHLRPAAPPGHDRLAQGPRRRLLDPASCGRATGGRSTSIPQAREALRQLVLKRDPLYARADATVDTALLTIGQAVDRVERALK